MANINPIISNLSFQARSLDDYLKPALMYDKAYREREAEIDEVNKSMAVFAPYSQEGGAFTEAFNSMNQKINEQAEKIGTPGFLRDRDAIRQLKKDYYNTSAILSNAVTKYEAQRAEIDKQRTQDASMRYAMKDENGNDVTMGINAFMNSAKPTMYSVSGTTMQTDAFNTAKALTGRISLDDARYDEAIDGGDYNDFMLKRHIKVGGVNTDVTVDQLINATDEQIEKWSKSADFRDQELARIARDFSGNIQAMKGKTNYKHLSGEAKSDIDKYITNGIFQGLAGAALYNEDIHNMTGVRGATAGGALPGNPSYSSIRFAGTGITTNPIEVKSTIVGDDNEASTADIELLKGKRSEAINQLNEEWNRLKTEGETFDPRGSNNSWVRKAKSIGLALLPGVGNAVNGSNGIQEMKWNDDEVDALNNIIASSDNIEDAMLKIANGDYDEVLKAGDSFLPKEYQSTSTTGGMAGSTSFTTIKKGEWDPEYARNKAMENINKAFKLDGLESQYAKAVKDLEDRKVKFSGYGMSDKQNIEFGEALEKAQSSKQHLVFDATSSLKSEDLKAEKMNFIAKANMAALGSNDDFDDDNTAQNGIYINEGGKLTRIAKDDVPAFLEEVDKCAMLQKVVNEYGDEGYIVNGKEYFLKGVEADIQKTNENHACIDHVKNFSPELYSDIMRNPDELESNEGFNTILNTFTDVLIPNVATNGTYELTADQITAMGGPKPGMALANISTTLNGTNPNAEAMKKMLHLQVETDESNNPIYIGTICAKNVNGVPQIMRFCWNKSGILRTFATAEDEKNGGSFTAQSAVGMAINSRKEKLL